MFTEAASALRSEGPGGGAYASDGAVEDDEEDDGGVDLSEIAVLIDQLKNEDVRLRVESNASLLKIAGALGPARVREELVPFVCDLTDDSDDVLLQMAAQLGALTGYVGGAEHAHVLLEPIEALCAVEEARVRERAVGAARAVCAAMPDAGVVEHYVPFVRRLGTHDWFTARISACGLFSCAAPRLPARERDAMASLFAELCRDDTPMVRRVAAGHLGPLAAATGAPVSSDTVVARLFRTLAADDQDSVRLQTVGNCVALAADADAAARRDVVLPALLATAADRSWRVRWSVAARFEDACRAIAADDGGDGAAAAALRSTFVALLNDVEPEVRCAAALVVAGVAEAFRAVAGAGAGEKALDALAPSIEALSRDASQRVRAALASKVGELAPALGVDATIARVLPVLLALLLDANAEVRLNVIANLGKVHAVVGVEKLSESLLPAIVDLADDPKWRVRGAIIAHVPLIADQLGARFFDDRLKARCVGWLADDVSAIREAATKNLTVLAKKFGAEWCAAVALPKVRDLARQRYYLRRITAGRALAALAAVLPPARVETDVLPAVLALADDRVPNVRFNAAAALGSLGRVLSGAPRAAVLARLRRLVDEDSDADVLHFAGEAAASLRGDGA